MIADDAVMIRSTPAEPANDPAATSANGSKLVRLDRAPRQMARLRLASVRPARRNWAAGGNTHENEKLRGAGNDVLVPRFVSERPAAHTGIALDLGFRSIESRFDYLLAKVRVAGSSPVVRSRETPGPARGFLPFTSTSGLQPTQPRLGRPSARSASPCPTTALTPTISPDRRGRRGGERGRWPLV